MTRRELGALGPLDGRPRRNNEGVRCGRAEQAVTTPRERVGPHVSRSRGEDWTGRRETETESENGLNSPLPQNSDRLTEQNYTLDRERQALQKDRMKDSGCIRQAEREPSRRALRETEAEGTFRACGAGVTPTPTR